MSATSIFEQRARLEQNFIAALMAATARGNCSPDVALDICPVEMLAEPGLPWAVYRAVAEMHKAGLKPTLDGVFTHIVRRRGDGDTSWPPVEPADVAALCASNFAYEDGVTHFAIAVRREGVKRRAEATLTALVTETQRYGNDLAESIPTLTALQNEASGITPDDTDMSGVLGRVLQTLAAGGNAKPLPTPWANLNSVLRGGICPGELAILAARPGLGKTALAGCLAVEVARSGRGVLFVSREVRDETLAARMLARESNVDSRVFREGLGEANVMPAIERAARRLENLPLRIVEKSTAPMTPREVRRLARGMKDCALVIVDYLQLLNPDEKHSSREREVAEMSRAMKQLALDRNCPVLLLSQINRRAEESERFPMLSDLRESGAIEQDADIVMFLHTKRANLSLPTPPVRLEVAKGRSSGTGVAFLDFHKPFANFTEGRSEDWKASAQRGEGNDF